MWDGRAFKDYCSGKIQNKLIMYTQVEFTRMAK